MRAIKSLGQNFLVREDTAAEIVRLSGVRHGDAVWEIGPGKGILTHFLSATGCDLTAIELDQRLETPLRESFGNRVKLIFGDILRLDWLSELNAAGRKVKLVANIPYNITSPILTLVERHHTLFHSITLMVQKEVGARICAKPGTKAYGALTLRLKRVFDSEIVLEVGKDQFEPVPAVDSVVMQLKNRVDDPGILDLSKYLRLLSASFAQRRKTLRNNLYAAYGRARTDLLEERSGMDFKRRAESLSESEFVSLSNLL